MKLPYRRLLVVTGLLVVSILVSFSGSAVRLFQVSGWLPVHPVPGLELPNWFGLWFGLYTLWEGLLIPPLGLAFVVGAWLYTKWSERRGQIVMPQVAGEAEKGNQAKRLADDVSRHRTASVYPKPKKTRYS
jgi:high-affinity iron transporter